MVLYHGYRKSPFLTGKPSNSIDHVSIVRHITEGQFFFFRNQQQVHAGTIRLCNKGHQSLCMSWILALYWGNLACPGYTNPPAKKLWGNHREIPHQDAALRSPLHCASKAWRPKERTRRIRRFCKNETWSRSTKRGEQMDVLQCAG